MADLNIYNPRFTREMPARNRACLYGVMPISGRDSRVAFNHLILSPGHTTGTEDVGADQMADLMQNLLCVDNFEVLHAPGTERIMLRAVPTGDWLRYRNHIPENKLIIRLPDGYAPLPEEERIMLGLRHAGAQFAMSLGDMGKIPQNDELLRCIDYAFIDHARMEGLLTAFVGLKVKQPWIKNIGFKESYRDFTPDEVKCYDYVAGTVRPVLMSYEERPAWQHELLRSIAEVFSGIYNPKQIVLLGVKYPEMGRAIKRLFGSQKLLAQTVKRSSAFVSSIGMHYSKNDMVNLMSVCLMYGLLVESEKSYRASIGDHNSFTPDELSSAFGYFRNGLIAGRTIARMAGQVCDDYETNHAFMVGLILYLPKIIRDVKEKCEDEFMLSAISDFYKGNGTLGLVLKGYHALVHKDIETVNMLAERIGITFPKEQYYRDFYEAIQWSDLVLGIISGRIKG